MVSIPNPESPQLVEPCSDDANQNLEHEDVDDLAVSLHL